MAQSYKIAKRYVGQSFADEFGEYRGLRFGDEEKLTWIP